MSESFSAVGMVEFSSITAGIESGDRMLKAASVEPLFFKTICPGKFVAGVTGEVAAVTSAIAAGRAACAETVVDGFVIANIHRDVVRALCGTCEPVEQRALGVIETFSAVSVVSAADAAIKAGNVQLVDVRIALGLGGKGYALFTGDVAACEAAVAAGSAVAAEHGLLVGNVVIPNPDKNLLRSIS